MSYREISHTDTDGNVWKLCLTVEKSKTNRYAFSFFLNHKEFGLAKLQSKVLADMTWDLVELTLLKKKEIKKEDMQEIAPILNERPKKRSAEKKPCQDTDLAQRPKKRTKKQ